MIVRTRCVEGRLRNAYPVAEHDVEIQVSGVEFADLGRVLSEEAKRVLADDPRCRKVVYAAPAGVREAIDAAESAGFRNVVEVDVLTPLGGVEELVLLVREPAYVTEVDMDLDRVPGS
ncbi:hypothetical protein ACIO3S_12530 [Nocardioides sp. NPDC087217]|uniref:hypothetical protein n=1 Tax=Nocardioides sp. NPDC087217 TaxID=3364335 RepID=UPI0037F182AC